MHNTPFTDMNDSEGEVQQAGYAVFEHGGRVLKLFGAFIPSLSINSDAVRRNTDASCITVTELADTLVRREQISFRQAHDIAAQTAQTVIKYGKPLAAGYATFRDAFNSAIQRNTELDQNAFEECVSAQHFVNVRTQFGGPACEPMEDALAHYQKQLDQLLTASEKNKQFHDTAAARCKIEFARLTEQGKR